MRKIVVVAGAAALGLAGGLAWAQMPGHAGHGQMQHGQMQHGQMQHGQMQHGQGPGARAAAPASDDPVIRAWQAANDRMHAGMAIDYTGEPDVDFVRGMIPHHQGAIDMARIVLEHGTDPEIRALAEGIIAAQQTEIAEMRAWLAARGY